MNKAVVELRRYSGEMERHCHDYHQVILPVSGALEIDLGHRSGRVSDTSGAFVAAGFCHAFFARPTDSFLVLDLHSPVHLWKVDPEIPAFFPIGREIHGLIHYMTAVGSSRSLAAPLRQAWSSLLLDQIAPCQELPDRAELGVRRAVAFMERNFTHPIRVADIADAAGMSVTRLHEAFIKRRGVTPHAQLVALRLDAAELMLADPRLSIANIAISTGHSDQSALTRAMRRERKATPGQVRRRLFSETGGKA